MIYRHYKGGLYFVEGYATPFSNTVYHDVPNTVQLVAVAKYEPTLEDIEVVIVYDGNVKGTYYAYKSETINGVMVFYRGLDGKYWLRPRENFYEEVEVADTEHHDTYSMPRFEKVSGEYLFDTITELLSDEKSI